MLLARPNGSLVDLVAYGSAPGWVDPVGASLQLCTDRLAVNWKRLPRPLVRGPGFLGRRRFWQSGGSESPLPLRKVRSPGREGIGRGLPGAGDTSMPRMRYCSTQPLGSSYASRAFLLLLLAPTFLGCSDEGQSEAGADLTVEWYDPETKMVKKSEGRQEYGREEGQWSYFHENGSLERQGSFVSGMKSGVWTGWYPNGAVMRRGSFVGDQPDGLWEEFHPTGVISARTSWANGQIIGKQQRFYPDGGIRTETPFAKGVPHGVEVVYHQGGEVYWAKNMVNGMAEGESVARHPGGGLQFIGTFKGASWSGTGITGIPVANTRACAPTTRQARTWAPGWTTAPRVKRS